MNDYPQPSYNYRTPDPYKAADAAERCVNCRRRIPPDSPPFHGLCEDCDHEARLEKQEWLEERRKGTGES